MSGDPSFDIPLRLVVYLLFRKDYAPMYLHLVLMPLGRVSKTGLFQMLRRLFSRLPG